MINLVETLLCPHILLLPSLPAAAQLTELLDQLNVEGLHTPH